MLQPHQLQILNDVWGFDRLRPHQEPVIDHVLENESALILMPTGGGKSLCYQLPGMLQPGLTLVVSPLIALMQDQVDDLRTRGVTAACLNSTLSYDEQRQVLAQIERRELKFLYAAPERLAANEFEFLKWLAGQGVARVAIDEAHCISSWGHSSRPEYTQLNRLREFLLDTPVLALTATADARTKQDIVDQLHLGGARHFVYSFDRPNIHYSVVPRRREKEQVLAYIKGQGNACGIVYCLSRKKTEEIAEFLQTHGISAVAYHAGIPADVKAQRQAQFKNDQLQVVVATIAFGMGIDKPDVRFVVHLNMPKNIESYYQETGRAGRDGEASEAILFAKGGDFSQLVRFRHCTNLHQLPCQMAHAPHVVFIVDEKLGKPAFGVWGNQDIQSTELLWDFFQSHCAGEFTSVEESPLPEAELVEWTGDGLRVLDRCQVRAFDLQGRLTWNWPNAYTGLTLPRAQLIGSPLIQAIAPNGAVQVVRVQ